MAWGWPFTVKVRERSYTTWAKGERRGEHVNIYNYMMSIWFSFFIIENTINRCRFCWFIPLVRFRFSSSTFHWFLSKEHARNISKWRPSFVNPWLYVLTAHSSDHLLFTFRNFSINSRFIYIWVCFHEMFSKISFFNFILLKKLVHIAQKTIYFNAIGAVYASNKSSFWDIEDHKKFKIVLIEDK